MAPAGDILYSVISGEVWTRDSRLWRPKVRREGLTDSKESLLEDLASVQI
jgi:hypothetical protein